MFSMLSIMNRLSQSAHVFGRSATITVSSTSPFAGGLVLVAGILALLVIIGAVVLVVVLLLRRKRPAPAQPIQTAHPVEQPTSTPVPAPQGSASEGSPGAAAAPTTPMRRCINGHIVAEPAAIFCPECGAGILTHHS